jgi:hypothetical protein
LRTAVPGVFRFRPASSKGKYRRRENPQNEKNRRGTAGPLSLKGDNPLPETNTPHNRTSIKFRPTQMKTTGTKKSPGEYPGLLFLGGNGLRNNLIYSGRTIFFHPDYTVGAGISPAQSGSLNPKLAGYNRR